MGWRGWAAVGPRTKRKLYLRKIYIFVAEKYTTYIEDVKQYEKHVPDFVESIIRPTDPVKEELRRKAMKMTQFRCEDQEIRVSTFWMSGKITDSRRRRPAGAK